MTNFVLFVHVSNSSVVIRLRYVFYVGCWNKGDIRDYEIPRYLEGGYTIRIFSKRF